MKLSESIGRRTTFRDINAVVIGNRIIVIDQGDGDRDCPGVRQPAIGIRDNVGKRVGEVLGMCVGVAEGAVGVEA
ncbi:MAG: hypothetical protein R3E68_02445 [Burkholderiaceae bacterium]